MGELHAASPIPRVLGVIGPVPVHAVRVVAWETIQCWWCKRTGAALGVVIVDFLLETCFVPEASLLLISVSDRIRQSLSVVGWFDRWHQALQVSYMYLCRKNEW